MAAFNPGEEQRTMEWIIRNYTIPPRPTTYVEFQFNFDDDTQPVFHIIWGEAIVDQPKHLHHFVVLGCTRTIAPEVQSRTAAASHLPYTPRTVESASLWAAARSITHACRFAGTVDITAGVRVQDVGMPLPRPAHCTVPLNGVSGWAPGAVRHVVRSRSRRPRLGRSVWRAYSCVL